MGAGDSRGSRYSRDSRKPSGLKTSSFGTAHDKQPKKICQKISKINYEIFWQNFFSF